MLIKVIQYHNGQTCAMVDGHDPIPMSDIEGTPHVGDNIERTDWEIDPEWFSFRIDNTKKKVAPPKDACSV